MHGEVNHVEAARLAVVGRVIGVAVEFGIVAARLRVLVAVVVALLEAQFLVVEGGGVGAFKHGHRLPVVGIGVPLATQRGVALPGVEVGRERGLSAIGDFAVACAHLGKHVERAVVQALALVLLAQGLESRHKGAVERHARDVATGVDAETVNTHLDERAVAVDEILIGLGVLGVQVHAVASNLCPPAVRLVPVEVAVVVPQVVRVVVHAVGVLHLGQAVGILLFTRQIQVVVLEFATILDGEWNHALAQVALRLAIVAGEQLAQVLLAEVARVVEHDVEDDFHAALVRFVNHGLETHVAALQALVHLAHVHGMVAVIVKSRGVLHHWRNPDGGEAQRLDVVHALNESLEVTTPVGVLVGNVLAGIPAVGVVRLVAVVEARRHHKVDTFVAEVSTSAHKTGPCRTHAQQRQQSHQSGTQSAVFHHQKNVVE